MAPRKQFPLLHLFHTVMILCCVVEHPLAFTIKLIHRYAPESPFYNANLTYQEVVGRLHFSSLVSSTRKKKETLFDLNFIPSPLDIHIESSTFLVKVSLGVFSSGRRSYSHKSYHLQFDTGSSVTWLQCEDCQKNENHCFRQIEPLYPNSKSSTYMSLPCGRHPLCFPGECIGHSCSYNIKYLDHSHSKGILASEHFVFLSTTSHEETIPIVFGCGIHNKLSNVEDEELMMAGILGLSWGPLSFVNQIHSISRRRFSYCLPPASHAARGLSVFLRFGSDIPSYSSLPSTRLIRPEGDHGYFVNLLDMSINGVRVNIPSSYFQNQGSGVGGCLFDTGSPVTFVSTLPYQMFIQAMEAYIGRSNPSLERVMVDDGYLCYRRLKSFQRHRTINMPSITYHFEGNADFVVKPEHAFVFYNYDTQYEYICLEMRSIDHQSLKVIIGSDAQANQFIVYDLPNHRMYFNPRDCSTNP